MKYRYLDLRNPEVKNNIILRCNVVAALRAVEPGLKGIVLGINEKKNNVILGDIRWRFWRWGIAPYFDNVKYYLLHI